MDGRPERTDADRPRRDPPARALRPAYRRAAVRRARRDAPPDRGQDLPRATRGRAEAARALRARRGGRDRRRRRRPQRDRSDGPGDARLVVSVVGRLVRRVRALTGRRRDVHAPGARSRERSRTRGAHPGHAALHRRLGRRGLLLHGPSREGERRAGRRKLPPAGALPPARRPARPRRARLRRGPPEGGHPRRRDVAGRALGPPRGVARLAAQRPLPSRSRDRRAAHGAGRRRRDLDRHSARRRALAAHERRLVRLPAPHGLDRAGIVVEQTVYASTDGTPITMFLIHRRDSRPDGHVPTVLTGYGGFNISRTPLYSAGVAAWAEAGGLVAIPNLRGGGEYGERWHRAGMLANKQNVFDDFLSAAEALIRDGWTAPARLAISGGSNGGLLVGAALTQRPDLFAAVVCAVPLLDMLRYQRFRIARLWIAEYGSTEDAEQFRWLRAYSPYHNVRAGIRYPAVLITTAEGDSRVAPMHARKMAALLQAQTEDPNAVVLLRVDRDAGHGIGKPLDKQVDDFADQYAFLAWRTGLASTEKAMLGTK